MIMAYWNGMTWGVSSKEIAFLESFATAFSIETDTNADKEGNSPTETVAHSLIEFSLSTTYRVETGTKDIRQKIESWRKLVGKAAPLVIGGATFGPDKVQLQSVGVSNCDINASGVMRGVTLSFKFKEFKGTAESGVSGGSSTNITAVNMRPSANDKAEKKTVEAKTVGNQTYMCTSALIAMKAAGLA